MAASRSQGFEPKELDPPTPIYLIKQILTWHNSRGSPALESLCAHRPPFARESLANSWLLAVPAARWERAHADAASTRETGEPGFRSDPNLHRQVQCDGLPLRLHAPEAFSFSPASPFVR